MNSHIWWRILAIVLFIVVFLLIGRVVYGQIPLAPIIPRTHTHLGNVLQVVSTEVFHMASAGGFSTVRIRGIKCSAKCNKQPMCSQRMQIQQSTLSYVKSKLEKNNVLLECDGECRMNKQKQKLYYVRLPDVEDLGLYLVAMGFCETLDGNNAHPRTDEYLRAQNEAKKSKLGIWKQP